ncbi:malectin domain-containing carbohydrate-binding protein [Streptomyces sp. NPDC056132]|uniref:malectin domain-containing carbohydrate-binding protein n=1 Tax=Streptomyces sp. NPDC056132 TaxID=3345722 RepID=UPI0035E03090
MKRVAPRPADAPSLSNSPRRWLIPFPRPTNWYFSRPGQRVFDVVVGGSTVLKDFDMIGTAVAHGADSSEAFGVEKDIPVTVADNGTPTVGFVRCAANQPQVNALAVAPAVRRGPATGHLGHEPRRPGLPRAQTR